MIIRDEHKTKEMMFIASIGPEYVEAAIFIKMHARMMMEMGSFARLFGRKQKPIIDISPKVYNKAIQKWRNWLTFSLGGGTPFHKELADEMVPGTTAYVKIYAAAKSIIHLENEW